MKQSHDRTVFKPVKVGSLTKLEQQRAIKILIFLTEKRDKSIKARTCSNGSTQRAYIPKEEAANSTVATDYILVIAVIDIPDGYSQFSHNLLTLF